MDKVSTWLWCDGTAEDMAKFYTGLIPDSKIVDVMRAPADHPSGKAGDVLTVEFTLGGRSFVALNGGPLFKFNEAISLHVACEDQAEVDRYWSALSVDPEHEQCGWLKDRYGLSWQIVPKRLDQLLADPDPDRARRAMEAMLEMKKLDIAALERAADGAGT
jgi:predicted 3-demethylubiquinone-9 3-methyltransferase (glyoxalase superfamily)